MVTPSREWWFVKRLLDGRMWIPLIFGGRSQFQTTDAEQIATTALAAANEGAGGIFNVADTDSPSVLEIGQAIAEHLTRDVAFVPVEESGTVGRTPWSVPKPFTVDGQKALRPCGEVQPFHYADHVGPAVDWLCDFSPGDWRTAFPQLAAYPWDMFDYDAEDRFFDERR